MIRKTLLTLALAACLDPTEITIVVTTNYACSDFGSARIRVGSSVTEASTCASDGTIGTLVVVPGGSRDAEIDIRLTGAVREGSSALPSLDVCEAQAVNGGGCVSTTRSLRMLLHRSLTLPMSIDSRCAHVACDQGTTCIAGACTPIACDVGSSNVVTCLPEDAGAADAGSDVTTLPSTIKVVDLRAHTDGTCAVLATGDVICWGGNAGSRFGDHGGASVVSPSVVPGVSASRIALGVSFACAVLQNGSIACWGDDTQGQLGDAKTTSRSTPQAIVTPVTITASFDDVYAGAAHACAHTKFPDSKIVCWGANASGQLGRSASSFEATPAAIAGNFTFMGGCAGTSHTCGIGNTNGQPTTDNTYCWGSSVGAFGTTGSATPTPTTIAGMTLPDTVACGDSFTMVALGNGPTGTGTWGDNGSGQTDPTKLGSSPLAPNVALSSYFLPVAAGGKVACGASTSSPKVTCWGDDSMGELGPNASGAGPNAISLDAPVKFLAAGSAHVCAVTTAATTDEVWCWGDGAPNPTRVLP